MATPREPNRRLAATMDLAGVTNKGLAKRIEELSVAAGETVRCNHTDIQRWLSGMRPQDPKPVLIARALSVKLGRHVPLEEIGLGDSAGPKSNLGLIYSPSLADAVATINELARFDGANYPAALSGPASDEAVNAACLDWLFGHTIWDLTSSKMRVSTGDVAEIMATIQMVDNMDRSSVGEFSRDLAVRYLREKVVPRLRGTYSEGVGRDLFRAAAMLCELIGYMAYDFGDQSQAQRYFIQSLRLAKQAGDAAYGAFVLNTMSHQAIYMENPRAALRLAQAARRAYNGVSVPIVATEASMLEALASAALGDRAGCCRAITDAEVAFRKQHDHSAPEWAAHWSETVFSSFAGNSWLTIGDTREARPHLMNAWEGSQSQSRRKIFAAGQLSKLATLEGNVEEAGHYALTTAEAADGVNSRRSTQVVTDLRAELAQYREVTAVKEFLDRSNPVTTK